MNHLDSHFEKKNCFRLFREIPADLPVVFENFGSTINLTYLCLIMPLSYLQTHVRKTSKLFFLCSCLISDWKVSSIDLRVGLRITQNFYSLTFLSRWNSLKLIHHLLEIFLRRTNWHLLLSVASWPSCSDQCRCVTALHSSLYYTLDSSRLRWKYFVCHSRWLPEH